MMTHPKSLPVYRGTSRLVRLTPLNEGAAIEHFEKSRAADYTMDMNGLRLKPAG